MTGMNTLSALYSILLSLSTGVEPGLRAVDCAIQLGTTWGSGKRGIKSTLHGACSVLLFSNSFLHAEVIVISSIWAGKDYVDPKRIGIWGWVRAPAR